MSLPKTFKIEWAGHGTELHPDRKPGTYWRKGDTLGFTPAPYNSRRIAAEGFDGKQPEEKFYLVVS